MADFNNKNLRLPEIEDGFPSFTPLFSHTTLIALLATLLVSGCSSSLSHNQRPSEVREALSELQSNPRLAGLAPEAMAEAEAAVRKAEEPQSDSSLAKRLNFLAGRKIALARTEAEARLEEQKSQGQTPPGTPVEATAASSAQTPAGRSEPAVTGDQTGARLAAMQRQIDELSARLLQSRLNDLEAKATDRGHLVVLEDALFTPGQAQLQTANPDRLRRSRYF